MTNLKKKIIFSSLILLLALSQWQLKKLANIPITSVDQKQKYWGVSLDPQILKRLLGLRVLFADLIWIDALFKSDTVHEAHDYTDFYKTFRSIIFLDPDNLYGYYVGGLYLSVIKDDKKGATAILKEGSDFIDRHPDVKKYGSVWQIPFLLGYHLLFEEKQIEEGGLVLAKVVKEYENIPEYVKRLGERAQTEYGRLELGIRILSDAFQRISSVEEKKKIQKKILELSLKQELVDLNLKFKDFIARSGGDTLSRKRQLQMFFQSIGHPKKDLLGRPLSIDDRGNIVTIE
jgi:hypothetical protein